VVVVVMAVVVVVVVVYRYECSEKFECRGAWFPFYLGMPESNGGLHVSSVVGLASLVVGGRRHLGHTGPPVTWRCVGRRAAGWRHSPSRQ
jgi:hypothetical protein